MLTYWSLEPLNTTLLVKSLCKCNKVKNLEMRSFWITQVDSKRCHNAITSVFVREKQRGAGDPEEEARWGWRERLKRGGLQPVWAAPRSWEPQTMDCRQGSREEARPRWHLDVRLLVSRTATINFRCLHADVWQKPTQFCKAIIFQLQISNFSKRKSPADSSLRPFKSPPSCSVFQTEDQRQSSPLGPVQIPDPAKTLAVHITFWDRLLCSNR